MNRVLTISLGCLMIFSASMTHAETLTVHPGQSIQNAISASHNGDVIIVEPGLYRENINFQGKAVIVRSLDPADLSVVTNTILDGGHTASVVSFLNDEGVQSEISGFTIQNGEGDPSDICTAGGGISCCDASPTISNNIIINNTAAYLAGGISIYSQQNGPELSPVPIVINNIIRNNTGYWGGGIYVNFANPVIHNNLIVSNTAHTGAGLYLEHCPNTVITSNTVAYNNADYANFGGIFHAGDFDATMIIRNCILWGNGDDLEGATSTYCLIENPDPGEGNLHSDPLFVSGPWGNYFLSRMTTGQNSNSPAMNSGSDTTINLGLSSHMTTSLVGTTDSGIADLGFHYFNSAIANSCSTWNQRTSTLTPPERSLAAMAYDSTAQVAILFGGWMGSTNVYLNDTWTWNGNAWTQVASTGPGGRYQHAMAYDSFRNKTVLFGGLTGGLNYFGDTWTWNGNAWTQVASTGPGGRYGHAMAYDSLRKCVVLFGGVSQGGVLTNQTWEWDGTTWQLRSESGPTSRMAHRMVFDSGRDRVVLFGGWTGSVLLGDTWEWDGTCWTQKGTTGPMPRHQSAMTYDSVQQRTQLFGGIITGGVGLRDTWTWDGNQWMQVTPISSPPARTGSAMAYDAARKVSVLFGGTNDGRYMKDTWEMYVSSVLPSITQQPTDQSTARGGNVAFSIAASSNGPPLTYQWQKDGVNLSNNEHITGVTTANLTITGVECADLGAYRCVVTAGYGSVLSNNIMLAFNSPSPYTPLVIYEDNFDSYADQSAFEKQWWRDGSPVSFLDSSFGLNGKSVRMPSSSSPSGVTDRWYHDLGCTYYASSFESLVFSYDLCLDPAGAVTNWSGANHTLDIRGYSGGGNKKGNIMDVVGIGVLSMYDSINTWFQGRDFNNPDRQYINLNTPITLPDYNLLYPPQRSSGWHHMETIVTNNQIQYFVDGQLSATSNNGLAYGINSIVIGSGLVANGHTMWADNIKLTVTPWPLAIMQQPASQTACPNGTAQFTIGVSSEEAITYQWTKNGTNLSDGGHYSGVTTSTLTISSAGRSDVATYRCVASAGCKSTASNNVSLTLGSMTSILMHPVSSTIEAGHTAHFVVTGAGNGVLTYQWQKNNTNITDGGHYTGATTPTLTVSHADSGDAASYRCVVTGGCGSANSNAATLTVNYPLCNNPKMDANGDLHVDAIDFDAFSACYNGPTNPVSGDCLCLDANGDQYVDAIDFDAFSACYNGPTNPPGCE